MYEFPKPAMIHFKVTSSQHIVNTCLQRIMLCYHCYRLGDTDCLELEVIDTSMDYDLCVQTEMVSLGWATSQTLGPAIEDDQSETAAANSASLPAKQTADSTSEVDGAAVAPSGDDSSTAGIGRFNIDPLLDRCRNTVQIRHPCQHGLWT